MKNIISVLRKSPLLIRIKNNWLYFVPLFLLIIFIFSLLNTNYNFGGDFIFPIKPKDNILRAASMWDQVNGGHRYFNYVLFIWEVYFYLLSLLHIPSFISMKIFIILTYIIGYVCSVLLYRILLRGTRYDRPELALLTGLLFTLNPAGLMVIVGTMQLVLFPVCMYFLIKYLDSRDFIFALLFAFFAGFSFLLDFPQAKLFVIFIIASIFIITLYVFLQDKSFKSIIKPLLILGLLSFLLNSVVLIPFLSDVIGAKGLYQRFTSSVTTYNGDADLYSAMLPYISRFYNENLANPHTLLGQFLMSKLFIFWTFFLQFLAVISCFFVREKKLRRAVFLCLFAYIIFIFIAKGANPPFGEIYHWIMVNIPPARIFRTTTSAVFAGVFFQAILITITIYFLSRRWKIVAVIFVLIHVLSFRAIYFGYRLDLVQINQAGIHIPKEYFALGKFLDSLGDEGKILAYPLNDGYYSKSWGYMGQSLIPWLTKKPVIVNNNDVVNNSIGQMTPLELCSLASLYNVKYVLQEKDTMPTDPRRDLLFPKTNQLNNQYFSLDKVDESCFQEHLYKPNTFIIYSGSPENIFSLSYLPKYQKNAGIINYSEVSPSKALMKQVSSTVVNSTPKEVISLTQGNFLNVTLGEGEIIDKVFYPYVRIQPQSPLYPLIRWKEEISLHSGHPTNRELIDRYINFASKRLSEIISWNLSGSTLYQEQKDFKDTLDHAIQTARSSKDSNYNLELVYEFLQKYKLKVNDLILSSPMWTKNDIAFWQKIFMESEREIKHAYIVPNYTTRQYPVTIPKNGPYHAYLLFDKDRDLSEKPFEVQIGEDTQKKASVSSELLKESPLVDLGKLELQTTQKVLSVGFLDRESVIDPARFNVSNLGTIRRDVSGITFYPNNSAVCNPSAKNEAIYQQISHWEAGKTYFLKIHSTGTDVGSLGICLREKKIMSLNGHEALKDDTIINRTIQVKPTGTDYQAIVKADENTRGAWIYLFGLDDTISVDEISLTRILNPQLLLVRSHNNQQNMKTISPSVSFTKINPTKYEINTDSLDSSGFIIFSEGYDPGWKIIGKGGKSLSESNHILVNGYANGWFIDRNNPIIKGSGKLTIIYKPQELFIIGAGLSAITFIISIGIIVYKKNRLRKGHR